MSQLRNITVRLAPKEYSALDKLREQHEKDDGRYVSLGEAARRAIAGDVRRMERRAAK